MASKIPEDKRDRLWGKLEREIQLRAPKKDKTFRLAGKWKKLVRRQGGFKIFAVDGEWIKNNLSVTFNHGGHGLVHEFIPLGEIWIATHHSASCGCKHKRQKDDFKVSEEYFESCTLHEMTEFKLMKKGMNYWKAHNLSLEAERKLGLLKDPNSDN